MSSERVEDLLGKQELRTVKFSEGFCSTCALIMLYDISSRESFEGAKGVLKAFQEYNARSKLYPRMSSARDKFGENEQDSKIFKGEDKNY
jgi:hypothetical protein